MSNAAGPSRGRRSEPPRDFEREFPSLCFARAKGGGGFRYYRLAPSLLEKDKWGNWVIRRDYNAAMLAEAVCKLEGFSYAPSDSVHWQHQELDL